MLQLRQLWLSDVRNYAEVSLVLPAGTTAILGDNGQGKTNLLEAVAHLAGTSLRGATAEAMVRVGAERGALRGDAVRANRELLIEAEVVPRGRGRIQLNRQTVTRRRDLLSALSVTLFSPEDLILVKGGPGERRRWIDDALAGLDPRLDQVRSDLDRILKQRNALLKSTRGRLDESAALTLDVWDERLTGAGETLAGHRRRVLDELTPRLAVAYRDLAGAELDIGTSYESAWGHDGLAAALVAAREDDLRRGITTVGPHRDEIAFVLDGLPARTHASQGEQRSLALAMRLAVHRAMTDVHEVSPILLLDDVLSELDDGRGGALLDHLPRGQTLLTSATTLPPSTDPDLIVDVVDGVVTPR